MNQLRIEVEDRAAGRGVILYIDPDTGTPAQQAAARHIVTQAVKQLAERTGRPQSWCQDALLAGLVLRSADIDGYQREAARRGVLAL